MTLEASEQDHDARVSHFDIIGERVNASKGLGYLMLLPKGDAKIALMFASLFVLALFAVVLHFGVARSARDLIHRAGGSE